MKTRTSYKPTHDDLFLHPNHHSVILLLSPINIVKKMLITKVQDPKHENLPKMETNPRRLRFSPKSIAHNFRSVCCCFPSIRLKNITVKTLGHLTRKLAEVTNQYLMTCFCTQTISISFSVIYGCFPSIWLKQCS